MLIVDDLVQSQEPDCGTTLRTLTQVKGTWQARRIKAEPGSLLIPVSQSQGNLIVYLMEPESDDGLTNWGFFESGLRAGKPHPVIRLPRRPLDL